MFSWWRGKTVFISGGRLAKILTKGDFFSNRDLKSKVAIHFSKVHSKVSQFSDYALIFQSEIR
jgi:hypothetical protein